MSDERGVVKYQAKDGSEVALTLDVIRKFLVHGKAELVTAQEMVFFMGICKARGLNPFAKDCYLIKYSQDPAAIVTSIDYFRARAKAQPDCKGWQAGIIVLRNGQAIRTSGLMLDGDKLIGGWFSAKPAGWETPFELEVNLRGYIKKTREGAITKFWQDENQPTQIRKVAESQGLRECWPAEFAKLYVEEEVNAGAVMDAAFTVKEKSEDKIEDLKTRIREQQEGQEPPNRGRKPGSKNKPKEESQNEPPPPDPGQGMAEPEKSDPGPESVKIIVPAYLHCPKINSKKHTNLCSMCEDKEKCQPYQEWQHEGGGIG